MEHRRIPLPRPERLAAYPAFLISNAVDTLIAALDAREGDPDLETTGAEDDFIEHTGFGARGPGCPLADPGGNDEMSSDRSYAEWDTLPAATRRAGKIDGTPLDRGAWSLDEDAEDDDPSGQCDEDGINTSFDIRAFGDRGPGCSLSDPGGTNGED